MTTMVTFHLRHEARKFPERFRTEPDHLRLPTYRIKCGISHQKHLLPRLQSNFSLFFIDMT